MGLPAHWAARTMRVHAGAAGRTIAGAETAGPVNAGQSGQLSPGRMP